MRKRVIEVVLVFTMLFGVNGWSAAEDLDSTAVDPFNSRSEAAVDVQQEQAAEAVAQQVISSQNLFYEDFDNITNVNDLNNKMQDVEGINTADAIIASLSENFHLAEVEGRGKVLKANDSITKTALHIPFDPAWTGGAGLDPDKQYVFEFDYWMTDSTSVDAPADVRLGAIGSHAWGTKKYVRPVSRMYAWRAYAPSQFYGPLPVDATRYTGWTNVKVLMQKGVDGENTIYHMHYINDVAMSSPVTNTWTHSLEPNGSGGYWSGNWDQHRGFVFYWDKAVTDGTENSGFALDNIKFYEVADVPAPTPTPTPKPTPVSIPLPTPTPKPYDRIFYNRTYQGDDPAAGLNIESNFNSQYGGYNIYRYRETNGNRYFSFSQQYTGQSNIGIAVDPCDNLVIEISIRATFSDNGYHLGLNDSNGVLFYLMSQYRDDFLRVANSTSIGHIGGGQWQRFVLVIDFQNRLYDVYKDGKLAAKDVAFPERFGASANQVKFIFQNDGGVDLDDFRIYEASEPCKIPDNEPGEIPAIGRVFYDKNVNASDNISSEPKDNTFSYTPQGIKITATGEKDAYYGVENIDGDRYLAADFLLTFDNGGVGASIEAKHGNSSNRQTGLILKINGDGTVRSYANNRILGHLQTGVQQSFRIVIDKQTMTCDIYINGELVEQSLHIVGDISNISSIRLYMPPNQIADGDIIIDFLKVYDLTDYPERIPATIHTPRQWFYHATFQEEWPFDGSERLNGNNSIYVGGTANRYLKMKLAEPVTQDMSYEVGVSPYYIMTEFDLSKQQGQAEARYQITDADGNVGTLLTIDADGTVISAGSYAYLGTLQEDSWLRIGLLADVDNNTYSTYVNGILVEKDVPIIGQLYGAIKARIFFPSNAGSAAGGDLLVDNIRIYEPGGDDPLYEPPAIRETGVEYEQSTSSYTDLTLPNINAVRVEILNFSKGIYRLTITDGDYTLDSRGTPFFFWSSSEGTFSEEAADYKSVVFTADPGTAGQKLRVTVGIGDGLGQVSYRNLSLDGSEQQ